MNNHKPIPERFANKVAIVTGGTAGIGFAIARQLGLEGAKIVITGLPADGTALRGDAQATASSRAITASEPGSGRFAQRASFATARSELERRPCWLTTRPR